MSVFTQDAIEETYTNYQNEDTVRALNALRTEANQNHQFSVQIVDAFARLLLDDGNYNEYKKNIGNKYTDANQDVIKITKIRNIKKNRLKNTTTLGELTQIFKDNASVNEPDLETFIKNLGLAVFVPGSGTTPDAPPPDPFANSKCIILYGPPGTGKTRMAKQKAEEITADNDPEGGGYIKLVQFHPSYSYSDFIETVDVTGSGGTGYTDRVFKEFAKKAAADGNNKYVLIIDEINRANVSEVLGELLYGLEYRGETLTTGISGNTFSVPDNLYIIGTMNTADKSLQNLDYAVRRRFSFVKVPSLSGENTGDKFFLEYVFKQVQEDVTASVARGIDPEDIMPGVSYFLVNKKGNDPDPEHFQYKLNYELIPLLKEYIKDGMFTKRAKIRDDGRSLIELVQSGDYGKSWTIRGDATDDN